MSRIGIITDSHISITQDEADRLGIKILPMPFYIGGECYYERKNIKRKFMLWIMGEYQHHYINQYYMH